VDDTVASTGWLLDDATKRALRIDRIARTMRQGSFQDAIVEAEELLDESPDDVDGLTLLGDASLEVGDTQVAVLAYEKALRISGSTLAALQGLAVARFELCDLVGCIEAAREALRQEPAAPDAHYFLGMALERLGHASEAAQSFTAAYQLAPESYPFPLELEPEHWRQAVREALLHLDEDLQGFWSSVPIMLEPEPTLEELRTSRPPISPRIAGMYVGTPPEAGDLSLSRPSALRLFTRSLSRSPSTDDLVAQIVETLRSEALNWLGVPIDDDPQ
jgi:tetratricopeptide (TPR) repeat protein